MFNRYLERLGNVFELEPASLSPSQTFILPDTRELLREPTRITLGLLDSYTLSQCRLFNLIADRNSILGKVSDPFRQFDYQVRFIQIAETCLQNTDLADNVALELKKALKIKKNELKSVYFSNLLWTSEAMRNQLTTPEWISDADVHHHAAAESAFLTLNASLGALNKKDWISLSKIQPYQETIEKQPVIGRLIYSISNTEQAMNTINDFLALHLDSVPCGTQRDNTQYRYLTNVFNQQYITVIQPYLSNVNQLYYAFSTHTQFLKDKDFPHQIDLDKLYLSFQTAILDHVELWQDISKRCGSLTQ